jgi:DUF971 family protein
MVEALPAHLAAPWPTALRLAKQGQTLHIEMDDGAGWPIAAELLRVESPSAEVKGHGPGQEQLVWGKRGVSISRVEPVGNYAVRLHFDDGHNTGIYTWSYLAKLGAESESMMMAYEAKLLAAGLSR